jgi:excisionase family DNA binding protein
MTREAEVPTALREWLSVDELAEWLGVPKATVYAWRTRGVGPRGASIGRHVRFRRADVEVWIQQQYASGR